MKENKLKKTEEKVEAWSHYYARIFKKEIIRKKNNQEV